MQQRFNIYKTFETQKDSLINRLEKKFYITIKDLEIGVENKKSSKGEIVMTLQNDEKVKTNFFLRRGGFVFSFNEGEIHGALFSTAKFDMAGHLAKEFEKVKESHITQMIEKYKIPIDDIQINLSNSKSRRGWLNIYLVNNLIGQGVFVFKRGKFIFDSIDMWKK